MTDQYAIYRANLLTEGKNLWQKSFEQVRKEHLPVRIDLYRQIHISFSEKDESVMEIWKKTRDITEVSDVLVLNRSGEISCYYVNEDAPRRITGFIRLNPSGTLVTLDTRDYKIEGYEGNWMAADDMIIDGRQFFLMEHQEFHRQAAMIVLDSYGRKVVEECKEGFNQEVKDKIYAFLQSQEKKRYPNKELKQRLEFWQKFFENGHYERSWESGMEVNYDAIGYRKEIRKAHPTISGTANGEGKSIKFMRNGIRILYRFGTIYEKNALSRWAFLYGNLSG